MRKDSDDPAKTRSPERQGVHGRTTGRFGGAATGVEALKLSPRLGVPKEVQTSFLLWLTAVAAGVLETIIRIINSLFVGSGSGGGADETRAGLRGIVYGLAGFLKAPKGL